MEKITVSTRSEIKIDGFHFNSQPCLKTMDTISILNQYVGFIC